MEPKIIGKKVENLINENQISKDELAKKIGIKSKTLQNKLEGKEEFYVEEIVTLTKLFNLTTEECAKIFFYEDK